MLSKITVVFTLLLSFSSFAKQPGFYTKGISASTAKGAKLLMTELIEVEEDHEVCYEGDYQSALDSTHNSISISIIDIYGESEFPPIEVEVHGKNGRSASGIVQACR